MMMMIMIMMIIVNWKVFFGKSFIVCIIYCKLCTCYFLVAFVSFLV